MKRKVFLNKLPLSGKFFEDGLTISEQIQKAVKYWDEDEFEIYTCSIYVLYSLNNLAMLDFNTGKEIQWEVYNPDSELVLGLDKLIERNCLDDEMKIIMDKFYENLNHYK